MVRRPAESLTPLELEIMKVLWEHGPAPVHRVRDRLAPRRDLAYNTVQTMLNVLRRKRRVRRRLSGRAYEYAPVLSREAAVRSALGDLVRRMFDGSPELLVLGLVETRQITAESLQRLSAELAADEAGGDVD